MKIRFNKFERVAGLFVTAAVFGTIFAMVGVAIQRGWFESKVHLETSLKSAEGVRVGTTVQMAGLRAGNVTDVNLKSNNDVQVRFEVSQKFHDRIRQDSVVRVVRPFIIGEKVLEVSVGKEDKPMIADGSHLVSEATADIMDLVSGRTLGPHLETLGKMVDNLKFVAEALFDKNRTKAMVKLFDELTPLVKNLNMMSKEATTSLKVVNKDQNIAVIIENLVALTRELGKALPTISQDAPELAQDLTKIAKNMAVLTDEMQKLVPLMSSVAPELPKTSRRALEALDETVVTLKALQRSFILRGSVKDVREEEAKRDRAPATEKADSLEDK